MSLWLKSMVGYLLIVSVVRQMLPNEKYEGYVRLFTGFLLIILVLQPILKVNSADSFVESKIQEFIQEQEALERQIGAESAKLQKKLPEVDEEEIVVQEIEQVRVEVTADD